VILPGVGAFKDAMACLREKELDQFIHQYVDSGRPLLGICLGMQLLFEESEENGRFEGLGLLKGRIVHIPNRDANGERLKVPHMGWNKLHFHQDAPVLEGIEDGHVYFVHSYFADGVDEEALLASADYGVQVPAVVGRGNVSGMQFHPEKSSATGMQLLTNFAKAMERSEDML
jgi:imidazole glycerol-phosphate synthase subunit HisH